MITLKIQSWGGERTEAGVFRLRACPGEYCVGCRIPRPASFGRGPLSENPRGYVTNKPLQEEPDKKTATLPKELSEFLLELSIGVHRYTMYPPGHPSLVPVAETVLSKLLDALGETRFLSIGVAQDQLVLEGVATESRHPVLQELARRLHGHQLASVTFRAGTGPHELIEFLQALSKEPDREVEPIGLSPPETFPSWENIRLAPVGYDQLKLQDDEGASATSRKNRAMELWLGLARSAMVTDEGEDFANLPEGRDLARSIDSRVARKGYDEVVVDYLHRLAEELQGQEGREAEAIRKQVDALIGGLDENTLARLVEMGGDRSNRTRFLLSATQGLALQSVMRIVKSAASSPEQNISHSLGRLLSKLSVHADKGVPPVRVGANVALRESVEELIRNWELEDPNPSQYTLILDGLSRSEALSRMRKEEAEDTVAGAVRLLQMSTEVELWGPTVEKAAMDLMEAGEAGTLLELYLGTPARGPFGQAMTKFLVEGGYVQAIFSDAALDEEMLKSVGRRLGPGSISALMDTLCESDSRSARRRAFDALAGFGSTIEESLLERLEDSRWYVVRNMLALAQRLPGIPEGMDPGAFTNHEDERVRREAFPLAFRDPRLRERALVDGLLDVDDRVVWMALSELQGSIPEGLVPVVVERIVKEIPDTELQVMGIRALGGSDSAMALDCLLEACDGGRSVLGKQKLLPTSPQLMAALGVLTRRWADDPQAKKILSAARRSKDPEVRRLMVGTGEVR